MARETCSRRGRTAAAFTLIELLLTVALMLLLAGAVIINFGSLDANARLDEGASQVETLFRYARAEAASTGRQVKIIFGSEGPVIGGTSTSTNLMRIPSGTNSGVQVLWEPEPVNAPGRFETLPGAELLVAQVNDLVVVTEVHPPGVNPAGADNFGIPTMTSAVPTGNTNSAAVGTANMPSTPPLICYPDGSSDSMEVVLATVGGQDKRFAVVTLSGLNGTARHRLVAPAADGALPPDGMSQTNSIRSQ